MYTTEFQVESPAQTDRCWPDPTPKTDTAGTAIRAQAAIESLLLACRYRNFLSDSEKQLLDTLAIDKTIAFLIQGDTWLHPSEFAPVPIETIRESVRTTGDALFVQRIEQSYRGVTSTRTLYTARIGHTETGDILLGMLGPDHAGNGGRETQFEQLVSVFRQSWRATEEVATALAPWVADGQPAMIINRASGRVILTTSAFNKSLVLPSRSLIDSEFSQARAVLRNRLIGHKLALRNIEVDGTYLSIVSLVADPDYTGSKSDESRVSRFLIHTIRNKLAAIAVAAGHLETDHRSLQGEEIRELSEIIGEQVDLLDQHLDRLSTIIHYSSYSPETRSVATDLHDAVERVKRRFGDAVSIAVRLEDDDQTVAVPRSALTHIVDALLRSHLLHANGRGRSLIESHSCASGTVIEMRTVPASGSFNEIDETDWSRYADCLATCMSAQIEVGDEESETCHHAVLRIPTKSAATSQREYAI